MKKINSRIRRFWGVSDIGFSFMSAVDTAFFVIFLTDVARLPLPIIAVLISTTGILDIITSILSGVIVDKVKFKNGKYRPWLIYCPPIVLLSFTLMFSKIGSDITAAIICGLGYVISHGIWNISWAANRTLVTVLTDDGEERAFLSARVSAGSSAGRMIAGYLVPTLSVFFLSIFSNSKTGVIGYSMTALVASLAYLFFYGVHYYITKGYDNPNIDNYIKQPTISVKDIIKAILINNQLIAIMIYDLLKLIPFYMIAASMGYYCKIVLNDESSVALLLVAFNLGTFLGCMLSNTSVKLIGSKNTNFLGMVMALCNTSIKVCIVIRGMIITAVLGFINYNPSAAITPSLVNGIKTLFFLVPIGFLTVSLIPLIWFKIKDSDVEDMEKVLK